MSDKYKVWIHIERYDEKEDEYEDEGEPFYVTELDTLDEAEQLAAELEAHATTYLQGGPNARS